MSINIIKAGILDIIQDNGRHGWKYLGINPGGAMDLYSAQLANIILGNDKNDAVIEIHFPGSVYQFEDPAVIVITGADFNPTLDEKPISLNQPVHAHRSSILRFARPVAGARCYMAVAGGLNIHSWMGSFSTNLKAKAGGFSGRSLMKGDTILFRNEQPNSNERIAEELHQGLVASHCTPIDFTSNNLFFIPGPEWAILTEVAISILGNESFTIQSSSNRMGYWLSGPALKRKQQVEMVSSPVTFGTIQLLPDGQIIILMADHQTTGGYPRIGCIISANLSSLAQKKPGDQITLKQCTLAEAEQSYLQQQKHLSTLEKQMQERSIEK